MIMRDVALSSSLSFSLYPDYEPERMPSLKWEAMADNGQLVVDRGVSEDYYTSTFNIKGTESQINTVISFLGNTRKSAILEENENYQIILESENDGEAIFGPDIDLSSGATCTIIDYGEREQINWRLWGLTMKVQVFSPAFVGTPTLPAMFCAKKQVKTYSSWAVDSVESYNGTFAFLDNNADSGIMEFGFDFRDVDMRNFLRYIYSSNRGAHIDSGSWPIFYKGEAVANPFDIYGPRRVHTASGFKIRELANLRYKSPGWWSATVVLIESFEATPDPEEDPEEEAS